MRKQGLAFSCPCKFSLYLVFMLTEAHIHIYSRPYYDHVEGRFTAPTADLAATGVDLYVLPWYNALGIHTNTLHARTPE